MAAPRREPARSQLIRSQLAVSLLCQPALDGPRTRLVSAYRGRAAWLLVDPATSSTVSLLTAEAVTLPRSVIVAALPSMEQVVSIGDGAVWYDERPLSVARWFVPSRIRRGVLDRQAACPGDVLRVMTGWRDRLGRGEGLTPYEDDVICGMVLGLIATDSAYAGRLVASITETDLEARTTAVSASLLRCACAGWCIPQVSRVVVALQSGSGIEQPIADLRDVGHSSGSGLLAGLAAVLDPALELAA